MHSLLFPFLPLSSFTMRLCFCFCFGCKMLAWNEYKVGTWPGIATDNSPSGPRAAEHFAKVLCQCARFVWRASAATMPSPLASTSSSAAKVPSAKECANACPSGPNVAHNATRLYLWLVVLSVAFTFHHYLSYHLHAQVDQQRLQLEHLSERVNKLTLALDRPTPDGDSFTSRHEQLNRSKRHTSTAAFEHLPPKIVRMFRWVDGPNWTDQPVNGGKTRRQVESLQPASRDTAADDGKQPAVDFFPRPQPTDQPSAGYEWLTSYCRIEVYARILSLLLPHHGKRVKLPTKRTHTWSTLGNSATQASKHVVRPSPCRPY